MENTINESQSRNAAKVAGFAAAIALLGTGAIKAKQTVSRRRAERKAKKASHLTVDE